MKNNPLLGHPGPSINAIEEFIKIGLIKDTGIARTLMLIICEKLTEARLFQEVHDVNEICLSLPDECE